MQGNSYKKNILNFFDLQSDIVKRLEKMEANGGGGADQDKGIKGNFAKTLLGTTTIDWWTKKFCFDAAM